MFKKITLASLMTILLFGHAARADDPLPAVLSKTCTPTEAAVFFNSRLHIKCRRPMQVGRYSDVDIYYFSISLANQDDVDNALQIATSAITSGKRLRIWAKTSSGDNPSGCLSQDCRKLTGITLLN